MRVLGSLVRSLKLHSELTTLFNSFYETKHGVYNRNDVYLFGHTHCHNIKSPLLIFPFNALLHMLFQNYQLTRLASEIISLYIFLCYFYWFILRVYITFKMFLWSWGKSEKSAQYFDFVVSLSSEDIGADHSIMYTIIVCLTII